MVHALYKEQLLSFPRACQLSSWSWNRIILSSIIMLFVNGIGARDTIHRNFVNKLHWHDEAMLWAETSLQIFGGNTTRRSYGTSYTMYVMSDRAHQRGNKIIPPRR